MEAKKTSRTVMQMKTPLGWSKSGRLVGNNKANIASDSKMRSVNIKANNTLEGKPETSKGLPWLTAGRHTWCRPKPYKASQTRPP